MLVLRDMIFSDIEDNVRWFTKDIEWTAWDQGKDPFVLHTEEEERASWTEYFEDMKLLPDDFKRYKFEIEVDGRHIGWVCSYFEMEFYEADGDGCELDTDSTAIGLCIPEQADRGHGYGTEALIKYMEHLRGFSIRRFYMEVWAGNAPMLAVAEKLGFREVGRGEGLRIVNGKPYDVLVLELRTEA